MAIDTDTEFLALFDGDTAAATTCVGALMGFISTIYESEIDTRIQVSYLRLHDQPAPFVESTPSCALYEVGRYWNDNETAVDRTLMHFLSGRPSNGGIAWVGVLCSGPFSPSPPSGCSTFPGGVNDNFGGAYGVSMGLDGNFTAANPNVVWDVVVVAHEIGHNFNSRHTHCYAGLGGNVDPVDQCFGTETGASCYAGPGILPGPQGEGSGTIMSYCHLRSGGLSNISMNFGTGHPFGVAPQQLDIGRAPQLPLELTATPAALALGGSAMLQVTGGSGDGATVLAVTVGGSLCSLAGATLTASSDDVGSCTVTASRSGGSFHEPAQISIDIGVFAPAVDLELQLFSLQPRNAAGQASGIPAGSYSVTVTNHEPIAAPALRLQVDSPIGLLGVLWTRDLPLQACEPPAGTEAVDTRFDLGIGESATVDLSSQLDPVANFVEIRARVLPGPGMTSLTPDDDEQRLVEGIGDGVFRDGFE